MTFGNPDGQFIPPLAELAYLKKRIEFYLKRFKDQIQVIQEKREKNVHENRVEILEDQVV